MTIWDWLPAFPWEGPPLPRFLGIYWPAMSPEQSLFPRSSKKYIKDVEVAVPQQTIIEPQQTALATYQNEEEWEISWTPGGLPTKIVVHRHAKRGVE